jgi:hypothetical protein
VSSDFGDLLHLLSEFPGVLLHRSFDDLWEHEKRPRLFKVECAKLR